jgi:hypothetical protein
MAISFNTGASANANNATSVNITIPSGVLTNDVMPMALACFTEDATPPTISFSGGGGTWTLVPVTTGTNPEISQNGTIYAYNYAYYRIATSGDPGATLTITETGSPSGTTWFAVAIGSYTGASTSSPIDVAGGASSLTNTVQCPAETTATANDWAIYLGCGGANGSSTLMPGPTGATSRESVASSAGIAAAVYDSNGSVGAAGTSIGGTSAFDFTTTDGSTGFLGAFTIGLAPPVSQQQQPQNPLPVYPRPSSRTVTQVFASGRIGAGHSR